MLLRREAEGVEMDVFFECGCLKMKWSFGNQAIMLKIIKLLEENGARYQVNDSSVYFWVAVNDSGQPNMVMG